MLATWKQFDATSRWLLLVPVAMAAVVTYDQWHNWSTKEDYTFGYLVPAFAAYVAYERWPDLLKLFTRETAPDASGDPVARVAPRRLSIDFWLEACFAAGAFFSLLCFLLGGVMRAIGGPNIIGTFLNTFGFCGVTAGILWMITEKDFAGRPVARRERLDWLSQWSFPVLVWIVSGPFIYLVDSRIKLVLLDKVTGMVVTLLNAFDYAVSRQANLILLPGGDRVGVADACSGIRSLTACVFIGAFISALFIEGRVRKLVMLGLSAAFAIVLNILRNTFLTLWAYKNGSASLDLDFAGHGPKDPAFSLGTVHDIAGYAAMGVTFAILAALIPIVNFRLPTPPPPPEGAEPPAAA